MLEKLRALLHNDLMRLLLLFLIFLTSCSVTWKKDQVQNKDVSTKPIVEKPQKKVQIEENWAREIYKKTYFVISNPKLLETKEDLDKICESEQAKYYADYQATSSMMFLKSTVTFISRDGLNKKVFITKGVCRELALYKNRNLSQSRQIRKSIDKVLLSYIYNEGTFLKEIVFKTPFKSVQFLVE